MKAGTILFCLVPVLLSAPSQAQQGARESCVMNFGGHIELGDGGRWSSDLREAIGEPWALATDPQGNLYVTTFQFPNPVVGRDEPHVRVWKLSPDGRTRTLVAGRGPIGFSGDGGPAVDAQLEGATQGMVMDQAGNLFILTGNRVRVVSPAGIITTYAGSGDIGVMGGGPFAGDGGPLNLAGFNSPSALALDQANNLYIADTGNGVIRRISAAGVLTTVAGSDRMVGNVPNGGLALQALLGSPDAVAVDSVGNIYTGQDRHLMRVAPDGRIFFDVAGITNFREGFLGDGGPASEGQLFNLEALAVDANDTLYIMDQNDNRIRRITPDGIITTAAGSGFGVITGERIEREIEEALGYDATDIDHHRGHGLEASKAVLANLRDIAVDRDGNLFVAHGDLVRKIKPSGPCDPAEIAAIEGPSPFGSGWGLGGGAAPPGGGGIVADPAGTEAAPPQPPALPPGARTGGAGGCAAWN